MKSFPLVLATRNLGKVKEIKSLLKGLSLKLFTYNDFPSLREVSEDGKTLKENALKKAVSVARATGLPALADDSGLFVKALHGAPGIHSARFAGKHASYKDNNTKLLRLLGLLPRSQRRAFFSTVIAVAVPGVETKTFQGDLQGWIEFSPRGKNGFGYDPVFVVGKTGKTMAELSFQVKNKISHRYCALLKAKKFIKSMQGRKIFIKTGNKF